MIMWFPNHLKSCFRSLPVFLFLMLGIPGCAQGGDSPSGGRSPALLYEEDSPLDHFLKVEIFSDFTVSISEKTMKPFCAVPAADSCWQETKRGDKISSDQYTRLMKLIGEPSFQNLPHEVDLAPGSSTITLILTNLERGTREVRVGGESAQKNPALMKFQMMIHEMSGL